MLKASSGVMAALQKIIASQGNGAGILISLMCQKLIMIAFGGGDSQWLSIRALMQL